MQMDNVGDHAVVLGAGIGGLPPARVLADAFRRVTVIERDVVTNGTLRRTGVPQAAHAHTLSPADLVVDATGRGARASFPPHLFAAVRDAEALEDVHRSRFPAGSRRYYERLSRFPDGLLVLGDGICGFNPMFKPGVVLRVLAGRLRRDATSGI
jgi:phytoene dehydrogenase-like protein